MSDRNCISIPFSCDKNLHSSIGNVKDDRNELSQSTFSHAVNYYRAGLIIYANDFSLTEVISSVLAFSCELFLKSILYGYSAVAITKIKKIHELLELFNLIPDEIKNEIRIDFDNDTKFDMLLREHSNAFVLYRYSNERKMISGNLSELHSVVEVTMNTAKRLMES